MPPAIERRLSFNGGEISPWTESRSDLDKFRFSCRTMENFRPSVYGMAMSRPGTVLVSQQNTPGSVGRLVAFEFSADTNLILEFTNLEMRVWTTGTTPAMPQVTTAEAVIWTGPGTAYVRGDFVRVLPSNTIYYCEVSHTSGVFATDLANGLWTAQTDFQLATPFTAAQLDDLQFSQQNDIVYITHPEHPPQILSRFANNVWTIEDLVQEWPATRDQNITATTITPAAVTGASVNLTATTGIFDIAHIGSRWVIIHTRDDPWEKLVFGSAAVGDTSTELFVLGEWSLTTVAGSGTGDWSAVLGVQRSYDKSTWETIRSAGVGRADRSDLITGIELEPCWLRVKFLDLTGTAPANSNSILEALDANHYGIVEINGLSSATVAQAEIIFELGATTATKKWREGAWSDYRGWPRSVTIHEQRLFFGGNEAQPQTVWASVINDYYNFRTGSEDDLGLSFTMAGRKANPIQWLVSQDTLLIGTAGEEGPLGSRDGDTTLTPANSKLGRFTTTGSAFLQAIAVQDTVLFVNRPRRKVWEMAFAFESDGYKANDLTLLAEHIADSEIMSIALQRNPETIIWLVTGDGQLIGLIYERAQQVAGWFRYVTDGTFESVAVVGGDGEEDQVWVTANRLGSRYIERFQPDRLRILKDAEDDDMLANQSLVCSSDCSVIYDGASTTTITGLSHLNGEAVAVLADGAVVEGKTVSGGQITLDEAAEVVIVGLPYTCTLQPTWQETSDPNSVTKVALKRMTGVDMELWRSMGAHYSLNNGTKYWPVQFRSIGDLMDQAVPLFSGMTGEQKAGGTEAAQQRSVIVRQTQPLPLNILSLHIRYDLNIPA
jgi:hypothetical protein